ncbi:hypothetical protein GQ44DRAFT_744586 [Phaeosphaeriaceae sp. PMI808]|nr:hypothetical protein GQ44DRAFT_744586 [Phaeosphaeriaceae sp. PMI808]
MKRTSLAATIDVPSILVENWTLETPITEHYLCGANELDFNAIYRKINRLFTHPRCPHRSSEMVWPCRACESSYLEAYWSSAAQLIDYFADFLHADRPKTCGFYKDYQQTLHLMNAVMLGKTNSELSECLRGPIVHAPSGNVERLSGTYNTGPYISGLKPWQQFLCAGGPGVAALHHNQSPEPDHVQYIPMGAIAIIKRHTERARAFAVEMGADVEALEEFDRHSLRFPEQTLEVQEYRSITGSTVSYHLINGAPPIIRHPGYEDEALERKKLSLALIDDSAAILQGIEAYEPVSGEAWEDGEEEDDEDEDEDEEAFDMWLVRECGGAGEGHLKNDLTNGWGKLFHNWRFTK